MLIAWWTGKKPTLHTYEMICFYFIELADEDELLRHIEKLKRQVVDSAYPDVFQYREIDGGSNFLGQNETTAHFGLGELSTTIDQITLQWPSGRIQVLYDVASNQRLVITESVPEALSLSLLLVALLTTSFTARIAQATHL